MTVALQWMVVGALVSVALIGATFTTQRREQVPQQLSVVPVAPLAEGLCFYLPLDGDANALVAKGNPMEMAEGVNAVFVEGKVGQGVHCGAKGQHRYLAYLVQSPHFLPNVRPEAGTIAFWVRPDWDGGEQTGDRYRHFFSIRSGLFYLYWHQGALTFSSTSRQLARHHYGPNASVAHWKAGEWHHLAVTWQRDPTTQRGHKRLYVDGQLVGEAKDVLLDFDLAGALIVGGIDAELERIADATIDEFAIWERELSPAEIRQLVEWGQQGKALADDPSVQKLAAATRRPASLPLSPQKGNLLPNASFEVGVLHPWRASNMTLQPDPTTKVHGTLSARFFIHELVLLTSGLFVARPNVPHTFSIYLRAEREGGEVCYGVYSAYVAGTQIYERRLRGIEGKGTLTPKWQRYTVSGTLPPSPGSYYFVQLRVHAPQPMGVWVDAAQLEEGEQATPFRPRHPWEAGLATDRPFHAFHPDEPVRVRVILFAEPTAPERIPLQLSVHDIWEQEVLRRSLSPKRTDNGRTTAEIPLRLPLGSYRFRLSGTKKDVLDELIVSVLPRMAPKGKESSMGIHVSANAMGVSLARLLGCGWVRILDASGVTHWDIVEPQQGQWAWETSNWIDNAINTYRQGGLQVLGLLFRTPLWASSGTTVNHPPKDLEAWRTYVRRVAEHFKGRIAAYEVWNEPYGLGLFEGKEALYVQMAQIAAEEIKRVDPNALIVAPCTYWGLDNVVQWTERVLAFGLLRFTDVFSFHGYEGTHPRHFQRVQQWAQQDGRLRPFWNTEQGVVSRSFYRFLPDAYDDPYTRWLGASPPSALEAAAKLVKGYLATLAAGGEKFFQYWAVAEDSLLPRLRSMSLLEFDNALRPKAVAWAIAGWLLDGSRPIGFQQEGELVALHFDKDGKRVTALWCERGVVEVPVPKGQRALTMMGTPAKVEKGTVRVGQEPVYFVPRF